ncbi:PR domain zinc finger protein 8-like protein [Lates japonicus]|uniref:PR domain zinc finger protein 8-like protein n=1 Tax=Lates japonicus TaxID=270547 RepID=A0AAD3MV47_LATJO|nr:PR domain zinc finger protein 8-like protein [Lates japonicus]
MQPGIWYGRAASYSAQYAHNLLDIEATAKHGKTRSATDVAGTPEIIKCAGNQRMSLNRDKIEGRRRPDRTSSPLLLLPPQHPFTGGIEKKISESQGEGNTRLCLAIFPKCALGTWEWERRGRQYGRKIQSDNLTDGSHFLPRSIWTGDKKFSSIQRSLQQWCDSYAQHPCRRVLRVHVLQNTFYDTIAFIAQKSCDKREPTYVFRGCAVRGAETTEAFLKAGPAARADHPGHPQEEGAAGHDQELSSPLGFTDMTRGSSQGKEDTVAGRFTGYATWKLRGKRRVTDFHNIARDLEHKTRQQRGRRLQEKEIRGDLYPKGRKTASQQRYNSPSRPEEMTEAFTSRTVTGHNN